MGELIGLFKKNAALTTSELRRFNKLKFESTTNYFADQQSFGGMAFQMFNLQLFILFNSVQRRKGAFKDLFLFWKSSYTNPL